MKKLLLISLVAISFMACISVCNVNESRCNATRVELCDADGQWTTVMDCDEILSFDETQWICCEAELSRYKDEDDLSFTCIPKTECEEVRKL